MQVVETKTDELTREFRVAVPLAEIERRVNERLDELARTVKLQGFRPGKVPMTLLRKRFGTALKSEAIEQAINESSKEVMRERGLKPAAAPSFDLAPDAAEDALTFTMAVEVLPEIPALDAATITLERLRADVEETMIEQSLERLAKAARAMEPGEDGRAAQTGDVVLIDIAPAAPAADAESAAPAADAEPATPAPQPQTLPVEIGEEPAPLARALIGLVVGDNKRISLPRGGSDEDSADATIDYDVTVKEIRVPQPQPIDDAFAQRYGVETVAALRERIRDEHAGEIRALSRIHAKRALLDQLNERYGFQLPKALVEPEVRSVARQLYGSNQAGVAASASDEHHHAHDHDHDHDHDHACHHEHAHDHDHEHDHEHDHDHAHAPRPAADEDVLAHLTDEQRAECRALAERRVRLGLVLAEVGRANNVAVLPEDVNKAILAEAQKYPGQQREVIEFFRGNARAREMLSAPILEEKVVDFILEMASVTERSVSVDELMRAADVGGGDD